METRHTDTVTAPLPHHRADAAVGNLNKVDIETIVDARIADHIHQINEERRRAVQEVRDANIKARAVTMGIGGVVGLGVGIGSTLLVQRMRRRSAAK